MNRLFNITTLVLQAILTFIVTFCIYMFFAIIDNNFGFDGLLGSIVFQPIIAIILSGLTIFICLIIGLPIRLNKKIRYWWLSHTYISIILIFIGFVFIFLALLPFFREIVIFDLDGQQILTKIPNKIFAITGWFLTAFSLLHIFPSQQLTERIKKVFLK